MVKHRGGTWLRHTEQLPEGWTIINHHCGFPLYFQKDTRIVTWARPYYIGNSSVKHHKGKNIKKLFWRRPKKAIIFLNDGKLSKKSRK